MCDKQALFGHLEVMPLKDDDVQSRCSSKLRRGRREGGRSIYLPAVSQFPCAHLVLMSTLTTCCLSVSFWAPLQHKCGIIVFHLGLHLVCRCHCSGVAAFARSSPLNVPSRGFHVTHHRSSQSINERLRFGLKFLSSLSFAVCLVVKIVRCSCGLLQDTE